MDDYLYSISVDSWVKEAKQGYARDGENYQKMLKFLK